MAPRAPWNGGLVESHGVLAEHKIVGGEGERLGRRVETAHAYVLELNSCLKAPFVRCLTLSFSEDIAVAVRFQNTLHSTVLRISHYGHVR